MHRLTAFKEVNSSIEKNRLVAVLFSIKKLILKRVCLKFVRLHPACSIESFLPISFSHVIDTDSFTRSWGMDEFAITHINAHMAESSL